jgi:hypothetical protein
MQVSGTAGMKLKTAADIFKKGFVDTKIYRLYSKF